jgi:hypothetical protein
LKISIENPQEMVENAVSDLFYRSYLTLCYQSIGRELKHKTREEDSIVIAVLNRIPQKNPQKKWTMLAS